MIESDWTIPAYAAREDMRRALEPSPPIVQSETTRDAHAGGSREKQRDLPAHEPLRDAVVLESEWTLPAYKAREDMRRAQEASPPIMESDWTLAAYRERNEALEAFAPAPKGAVLNEPAPKAPEIRIDFPPAWLERPESGRGRFPMKRLAYAAGATAVVAMAAFAFRSEAPVATSSSRPGKLESQTISQPASIAPPPATPPTPATSTPSLAPPAAPQQAPHAAAGAGGNPPSAAAPSPASAPTPNKREAGAQQAPAPSAAPERPAETKSSPPRKPRAASEPRQKPARERPREGRRQSSWFDEMVNSLKKLGRVLTP